jgi:hypothetical protein
MLGREARVMVILVAATAVMPEAASGSEAVVVDRAGETGRRKLLVGAAWNAVLPSGDTRNFIADWSPYALSVSVGTYLGSRRAYAGLSLSWAALQEDSREHIFLPAFDAGGDQSRRFVFTPVLAEVGYEWLADSGLVDLIPYVRLGAGGYRVVKKVELGITDYEDKGWHAGISPGTGLRLPLFWSLEGNAAVRFHYIFDSGDGSGLSYFSIGVGLVSSVF